MAPTQRAEGSTVLGALAVRLVQSHLGQPSAPAIAAEIARTKLK